MLYSVNFNKEQLGDEVEDDSPYYWTCCAENSLASLLIKIQANTK